MATTDEEMESIGILSIDQALEPYKEHFEYRIKKYVDQKGLIETYEGGLEEFAQGEVTFIVTFLFVFGFLEQIIENVFASSLGYVKFGFNREEDGIVYREWAPAAQ